MPLSSEKRSTYMTVIYKWPTPKPDSGLDCLFFVLSRSMAVCERTHLFPHPLGVGIPGRHSPSHQCHDANRSLNSSEESLPDIGAKATMAPTPVQRRACPCLWPTLGPRDREATPPGSCPPYRGTSLIRNRHPLGPYSRTIPRAVRWP